MNDKEAFEKHINVICNKENDYERFYAIWEAACDYKNKEYSNLMDAMTLTSQNNFKLQAENKKLQDENAKLKECLEFYAVNGLASVEIGKKIDERICHEFYVNGEYARQVLKELKE